MSTVLNPSEGAADIGQHPLPSPSPRRLRPRRDTAPAILMALPAVAGLIIFVAVPFLLAVVLSFFNVQIGQVRPPTFLGPTYYIRLFTDPIYSGPFLQSLFNNFVFAIVVIPVQTGLALLLAVLLNQKLRGIAIFRTFFFMPVVFPMALVAVIWRLILERSPDGLLNAGVHFLTAGLAPAQDWLGSSTTAMGSIILLSIWQGVGFQMIIILAALQEIPEERYEAAQLDRANAWQRFRNITVPGARNTLIFVIMLTTIYAFRVYDQVYILIKAGANQAATQTVLYQATSAVFDQNNYGLASAITVVFFCIIVTITVVQRRLLRQRSEG